MEQNEIQSLIKKLVKEKPSLSILVLEDEELAHEGESFMIKTSIPTCEIHFPKNSHDSLEFISKRYEQGKSIDIAFLDGRLKWGPNKNVVYGDHFVPNIKEAFPECITICISINEKTGSQMVFMERVDFWVKKQDIGDWLQSFL